MSTAEKQTAGRLGSSGAKDFLSSCIDDHQDNNKLMKREHDASYEHDEVTSNPNKQKQLFLTLTAFDEDDGEDPNEDDMDNISYHAKDDVSDKEDDHDGLNYLGTEPGTRRMVESVNVTFQHQWDMDLSWVKNAHKGFLKVLRIKLEGLMDQKRDCRAILVQILEQADNPNIFPMGSEAPEDLSLHELWHKAQVTGLTFIHFHPCGRGCWATLWESRGSTIPWP